MKSIYLWHGAIGIALVCVGIGIIGGVAYLLYGPGISLEPQESSENAVVYVCGDMRVSVGFFESNVTAILPDGRSIPMAYTPPTPEASAEVLVWQRYASSDGSFIFWRSSDAVFFEEKGNILYGECRAENQG